MASGGQEKIYEMVTDRILEKLEQGIVPWHKPWAGGGAPLNLMSKKEYRGCNVWQGVVEIPVESTCPQVDLECGECHQMTGGPA